MIKDLIPAVAYCRVSTLSDDQENSFENQKSFFHRECERLGYYLVEDVGSNGIFADRGISAKSMIKRPEFLKMVDSSKTRLFQMILCSNISRFSRNVSDLTDTIRQLKKNNVYVHFIKENLQTNDSNDDFVIGILSQIAQQDIVEMSKKIQFGMREAQQKGIYTSMPPYGYNKIDGYLQVNEDEKEVVETMFYLYTTKGFSIDKITRDLNAICIPSKKGKKWQHTTIRHIITNPIYIGIQINHKTEMKDIFINLVEKINEYDQIRNHFEHLQIIDKEIFIKAQEIKKERSKMADNNKKYSSTNILSNIFTCGNCHASMKRMQRSDKKGVFFYVCGNCHKDRSICPHYNYITEIELFKDIANEVEKIDKEEIKRLYQYYIDTNLGLEFRNSLPEINSKIDKLENRKKNFQVMKADGDISKNDFRDRMNEVEDELKDLHRNKDRILNIEREINITWDTCKKLIFILENFDINNINNEIVRILIQELTRTTINGKKVNKIKLNTGMDKDFSIIAKEYALQNADL